MAVKTAAECSAIAKIGDVVYLHDGNRRHYEGYKLVDSYSFVQRRIVGETKVSWVLDSHSDIPFKIDKKTGLLRPPHAGGYYGWSRHVWWSREAVLLELWMGEHRAQLAREVTMLTDPQKLAEVYKALFGVAPQLQLNVVLDGD